MALRPDRTIGLPLSRNSARVPKSKCSLKPIACEWHFVKQ